VPTCLECSKENPDEARFCLACGSPFTPAAPERRKLATLLFCDMSGSTAMGERVDAESVREMMFRYFHTMREAIERHGGTVEKFIGDAVMAVFGLPTAHEDDALRAVRAAAEMQERLADLNPELERRFGSTIALRIGLNTGEVVAGDATTRQTLVTGDAVNVAARLEQAAGPGEVLLGETTYRLCRDAVTVEPVAPLTLKGKSEPLPAYRLLAVAAGAPGHVRRLEAPMVAREEELRLLANAFAEAAHRRSCRLVTVVGEPGVGKSRLATELISRVAGEATVLSGRCLSYGEGITFWAIGEIVRDAAGIRDEHTQEEARARIASLLRGEENAELVATRVAQAVGLAGGQAAGEEIPWAIRKLFEALARRRPVLLFIDDIHWAEPALLDLLASLPELSADAPILLLCLARPELLEQQPEWEAQVRLEPLAELDSGRLLENLLGNATIAAPIRERIAQAAGGNPLFVEELVAMLVEDGLLRRENGSWVATEKLAEITIPPTLSALLGARLDQLGEERAALERGAIEGQVFHRGALAALSPPDEHLRLEGQLAALTHRELVHSAQASFADEAAYRFRHILIRDAAYQATSKKLRAELHERFADWLEQRAGERVTEYEEILGYHLEQAYRYREQLGPADTAADGLAVRAAELLASAAEKAFARGDMRAAANLYGRAVPLLSGTAERRLELLPAFSEALLDSGDLRRAINVASEAIEKAGAESPIHARAVIVRLLCEWRTDFGSAKRRATEEIERAIRVLERAGDQAWLARAWRLKAFLHDLVDDWEGSVSLLRRAAYHAQAAGDRLEEARDRSLLTGASVWGPVPVEEGIAECQEVLGVGSDVLAAKANTLANMAVYEAMACRFDEARRLLAEARALFEELGLTVDAAVVAQNAGYAELLAENPAAAVDALRGGIEMLAPTGERANLSYLAGLLAEALRRQGCEADAATCIEEAREAAASDDVVSQLAWRLPHAKILSKRGDIELAFAVAHEGLAISEHWTHVMRADALAALGEVAAAGGRRDEAISAFEQALRLHEAKGNRAAAKQIRAALKSVATPAARA
jgi:predicted ATPase/class 3 adenylate cyclase